MYSNIHANCYRAFKAFREQCADHFDDNQTNLCVICGCFGEKVCEGCSSVTYCSHEHQLYHWEVAGHENTCRLEANAISEHAHERERSILAQKNYPLSQISHMDEENATDVSEVLASGVSQSLALTTTRTPVSLPDWTGESFEGANSDVDKAFLRFQKRIRSNPTQILRYARCIDVESPQPLWASDYGKLDMEGIPNCDKCGGARSFEFQIMPQILNHLSLNHADSRAADFGTVCIYTCHNNCDIGSGCLQPEYAYCQQFSNEGLGYDFKSKRFGF